MREELKQLFEEIVNRGASDLHIVYGASPRIRVNGILEQLPQTSYDTLRDMIIELLSEAERTELQEHLELDISFEIKNLCRFRANYYYTQGELSAIFRAISFEPPTLKDLRSPPIFSKILERGKGLILFCGATGSGKSSSIAAMLNHINQTQSKHIITLEDPLEFVHSSQLSHFSHRSIKQDTKSYPNALKSALREDPDIIYIGEIRDNLTLRLALDAASSGHLVFSTLHASSSVGAITRAVGSFKGEEQPHIRTQLSETLLMVTTQALIPSKSGGKVPAYEILINTPAIANLIREAKFHQIENQMALGLSHGMQLLNDSLKMLVSASHITPTSALNASYNPNELSLKLSTS